VQDEKIELKITVERSDHKLYFRMAGATADLPDGRQIVVEPTLSGAGVVVTMRNVDKTSRTYYFDAHALGTAVLEHEDMLEERRKLDELNAAMNLYTPKPGECICWKCLAGKNVAIYVVCPTCGNKRCPKASDHELACTGSNEPGQPGSVCGTIEPPATGEQDP